MCKNDGGGCVRNANPYLGGAFFFDVGVYLSLIVCAWLADKCAQWFALISVLHQKDEEKVANISCVDIALTCLQDKV